MWSKYICVCICQEAGWDLGLSAIFFNIFFLPKKKSKICERKPQIISNLKYKIWAHRPSINSTKPLFTLIKAIIIIILQFSCKMMMMMKQSSPSSYKFHKIEEEIFFGFKIDPFEMILKPVCRKIRRKSPMRSRILLMMIAFYHHSWRNNVVIAFGTLSSCKSRTHATVQT